MGKKNNAPGTGINSTLLLNDSAAISQRVQTFPAGDAVWMSAEGYAWI